MVLVSFFPKNFRLQNFGSVEKFREKNGNKNPFLLNFFLDFDHISPDFLQSILSSLQNLCGISPSSFPAGASLHKSQNFPAFSQTKLFLKNFVRQKNSSIYLRILSLRSSLNFFTSKFFSACLWNFPFLSIPHFSPRTPCPPAAAGAPRGSPGGPGDPPVSLPNGPTHPTANAPR